MRGMGRGGRGLSTGPLFVEIGRVDTVMGTSLAEGGVVAVVHFCRTSVRARPPGTSNGRGKGGGDD